ncbi:hypothetical protein AAEU33_20290 [Chryseobacterium sp. Chry.R1]|uniref:hypothetical protein n=1 Tax=Chryseobacterium sp. Chry.R1 TaxID=3139392 RepID=UPI0031F7751C
MKKKILFALELNNDFEPKLKKGITTIGYILQRGYFLAQRKFFVPKQFRKDDIIYVTELCGLKFSERKNMHLFALGIVAIV